MTKLNECKHTGRLGYRDGVQRCTEGRKVYWGYKGVYLRIQSILMQRYGSVLGAVKVCNRVQRCAIGY